MLSLPSIFGIIVVSTLLGMVLCAKRKQEEVFKGALGRLSVGGREGSWIA
jgi:hypothetical protein